MFKVPILFLIFNRPDTTQKVFDAIKAQKPKFLFVAADGPRPNREDDLVKCDLTRGIINQIDWDCELKTLYREKNVGCGRAVSTAISWFFEYVEEGIILEDDCLPEPTFFNFCSTLLKYYKNDRTIMHIGGSSLDNIDSVKDSTNISDSYYFSKYMFIWGWATWKRAWAEYDFDLNQLDSFKNENKISNIFNRKIEQNFWIENFERTQKKEINTWDYQWYYSVWRKDGYAILPYLNLVTNLGLGHFDSTNTNEDTMNLSKRKVYNFEKITHPHNIQRNLKAENYAYRVLFQKQFILKKVLKKLGNYFKRIWKK